MTKNHNPQVDKNLQNVVKDLNQVKAGSFHAQQIQQDVNDRRHRDEMNHEE